MDIYWWQTFGADLSIDTGKPTVWFESARPVVRILPLDCLVGIGEMQNDLLNLILKSGGGMGCYGGCGYFPCYERGAGH